MNVMVINGSYRKTGMTNVLIESFIKGFKSKDPQAEIRRIDLIDLPLEFCRGCNTCSENENRNIGSCVINDPAADILRQMVASDIVVFATPIYCYAPTAVMKRFIERCVPLFTRRQMGPGYRNKTIKGKKGLILLSSGAPYPFNVMMGMTGYATRILKRFCKASGCEKTYVVKAGGMEANEKWRSKWIYAAYMNGVKVAVKR